MSFGWKCLAVLEWWPDSKFGVFKSITHPLRFFKARVDQWKTLWSCCEWVNTCCTHQPEWLDRKCRRRKPEVCRWFASLVAAGSSLELRVPSLEPLTCICERTCFCWRKVDNVQRQNCAERSAMFQSLIYLCGLPTSIWLRLRRTTSCALSFGITSHSPSDAITITSSSLYS